MDQFSLKGKVAIITGGAGLLGVQHAIALAQVGAGVVMTDISPESMQKAARAVRDEVPDADVTTIEMDVTNRDSIAGACRRIVERSGRIDILVNNAAIDPKVKSDDSSLAASRFEHFPLDQWDLQVRVGLTGAYLCSQVFGEQMVRQGSGVILNIASDLSVIAPDQRLYRKDGLPEESQPVKPVTYSVIKSGLVGLTRYLASYWADKGIRVNALSPGGVYNGQPQEFVDRLVNLIPMGRMANKDEYRGAIQFLCSDASKYLTGQNLVLDGGRSII